MVTFLVCLVVVGGAMAAIVVLTMRGVIDQPATEEPVPDRAGPLRTVGLRAASYLVPSGPSAPSRPRTPPDSVGAAAGPGPGSDADEAAEAVGAEADPPRVPAPPGPGHATATVAASPAATPPQDGPTLEMEDDPTATMAVSLAGALPHGDDTIDVQRQDRAPAGDDTAVLDRGAADQTMAMPVLDAAQARAEGARGPVLQRARLDDGARHADAAVARTRSWRALRRLRGMALLVAMMVGLGTLLALILAGLVALVAIGIRAAVGT